MEESVVGNLLSPKEVANRLSISRWTVYDWISTGRVFSVKVNRLVRIPESELERLIEPRVGGKDR